VFKALGRGSTRKNEFLGKKKNGKEENAGPGGTGKRNGKRWKWKLGKKKFPHTA